MSKVSMIIFLLILVIILTTLTYLHLSKDDFCKEYALNSYGYDLAMPEDKDKAYKQAYDYCSDNYLKIKLLK